MVARRALGTVVMLAACSGARDYPCDVDAQCIDAGVAGVCQSPGWCSFPDDGCPSQQRYGELAGDGLAGLCVPLDGASTGLADDDGVGPTSTDAAESTSTVSSTTPLTTGADDTTSAVTSTSSSISTTGAESTSETTSTTPMCPTFVDDFDDDVISTEWESTPSDLVTQAGGARIFTVTASSVDGYARSYLADPFDLTAGWVSTRIGAAPVTFSEQMYLSMAHVDTPDDLVIWFVEGAHLFARLDDPNAGWEEILDTPYVPDEHRWLRMRGEGSTVYFEVAGDDEVFEALASHDVGYALDPMFVGLYAGNYDDLVADVELSFEQFEICSP
jgi:hypothetical protein